MSAEPEAVYVWRMFGADRGRAAIDANPQLVRQAIDRVVSNEHPVLSPRHLELVSGYVEYRLHEAAQPPDALTIPPK